MKTRNFLLSLVFIVHVATGTASAQQNATQGVDAPVYKFHDTISNVLVKQ